jgi:hypothetical protein
MEYTDDTVRLFVAQHYPVPKTAGWECTVIRVCVSVSECLCVSVYSECARFAVCVSTVKRPSRSCAQGRYQLRVAAKAPRGVVHQSMPLTVSVTAGEPAFFATQALMQPVAVSAPRNIVIAADLQILLLVRVCVGGHGRDAHFIGEYFQIIVLLCPSSHSWSWWSWSW